jgi:hypothetical protein
MSRKCKHDGPAGIFREWKECERDVCEYSDDYCEYHDRQLCMTRSVLRIDRNRLNERIAAAVLHRYSGNPDVDTDAYDLALKALVVEYKEMEQEYLKKLEKLRKR